ncbi:PucR family transcriptional regulator [Bacillus lacus]|uniref:PucR family transcriptional regulator n=1 Tax=Metabacillus lacus TaxID=1983721 RepID=A0A7X2J0I1_9BACI|nr:PucR family transcriptional regulator [Metabacillus lacus]MRX73185.1 PucR family transcriptional regulator [Metabacillus lacus]
MSNLSHDPFRHQFDRLEEVADSISDVLQCPITIEDVNHRLLAYSTHDECTDQARISTIIGRRVPEKVINSLWKDGTIPALLKTSAPVRVKNIDEVGLGNRVAISIWKNDEVLGFIWALEIEKKLSDSDLELLKKAAQAVKNKLLNLQIRKTKKEERNQEFFWKLLTGHMNDEDEITDGFLQMNMTPPPVFSIVLFKFPTEISAVTEKQLNYLLQTTQQVHVYLSTADYDELVILVSPKTDQPLNDFKQFTVSIMNQLQERFKMRCIPSIGAIHEELAKIDSSYKEAQNVISIKRRFPTETAALSHFSELGIYQYLELLQEKRKQFPYENYSLKKLKEYDHLHKTDLVETLEVFLDSDSNMNDAAKSLNVHVNTLSYRMKRISQIGELNLKNPNHKMSVYLDLKLQKMPL